MPEVIKVLLVDDQELVRYGLRLVLEAEDDVEIVGEASDGIAAVDAASRTAPDVVIMDAQMPRLNGIEATRKILAADHSVRILVLTTWDLDEYAFGALTAGASGFLLKDSRPESLVDAVRTVYRGDAITSPRVTSKLIEMSAPHLRQRGRGAVGDHSLSTLTSRELDVFTLAGRGLTNAQIAHALSVSESTVKTHFGQVLSKLGLANRVDAVILAYEVGVVSPGGSN